ncbi:acyl-CoA carboxylase epsilon subunit [Nonomuraea sp. NPDC050153]|uniref:acyl-CoA carboxylase epsilon subunit n=1 Tax=Nonomuraea sp. NPDC050153 TaxID=3364359 RepID=UPI0037AD97C9
MNVPVHVNVHVNVQVDKGNPSPEELAALVVALRAAAHDDVPEPAPGGSPARRPLLRRPLVTGPRGWRESRWSLGGSL